jgi:hypothetical protein
MQLDQEAREGMEKYMKLIQEPADIVDIALHFHRKDHCRFRCGIVTFTVTES